MNNNLLIWNKYLEDINKSFQADLYNFCQKNTSFALEILGNFHADYVPNFWIGPGWIPLIFDTHKQLSQIDNNYIVYQIKEKFGGLRYYAEPTEEKNIQLFVSIINDAEAKSLSICEICSNLAQVRKTNYTYRTLCDTCVS